MCVCVCFRVPDNKRNPLKGVESVLLCVCVHCHQYDCRVCLVWNIPPKEPRTHTHTIFALSKYNGMQLVTGVARRRRWVPHYILRICRPDNNYYILVCVCPWRVFSLNMGAKHNTHMWYSLCAVYIFWSDAIFFVKGSHRVSSKGSPLYGFNIGRVLGGRSSFLRHTFAAFKRLLNFGDRKMRAAPHKPHAQH